MDTQAEDDQFDEEYIDGEDEENSSIIVDTSEATDDDVATQSEEIQVGVAVAPPASGAFGSDDTVDIWLGAFDDNGETREPVQGEDLSLNITGPDEFHSVDVTTDANGSAHVSFDLQDRNDGEYDIDVQRADGDAAASVSFDVGPVIEVMTNRDAGMFVGEEMNFSLLVRNGEFGQAGEELQVTVNNWETDDHLIDEVFETDQDGFVTVPITPEEAGRHLISAGLVDGEETDSYGVTATEVTLASDFGLREGIFGEQTVYGGYLHTADGLLRNSDIQITILTDRFDEEPEVIVEEEVTTDESGFFLLPYETPEDLDVDRLYVEAETADGTPIHVRFDRLRIDELPEDDDTDDPPTDEPAVSLDATVDTGDTAGWGSTTGPGGEVTIDVEAMEDDEPIVGEEIDIVLDWESWDSFPFYSTTVTTDENGMASATLTVPEDALDDVRPSGDAVLEYNDTVATESLSFAIEEYHIGVNADWVPGEQGSVELTVLDQLTTEGAEGVPAQFIGLRGGHKTDTFADGELISGDDGTAGMEVSVPADLGPSFSYNNYVHRYEDIGGNWFRVADLPGTVTVESDADDEDQFSTVVRPGEMVTVEFDTESVETATGIAFARYNRLGSFATEISSTNESTLKIPEYVEDGESIRLQAWAADENGIFYEDEVSITVEEAEGAEAAFEVVPENPLAGPTVDENLTFDASASTAAETYSWDFGDGTGIETDDLIVEHSYDEPGEYAVTLTVTDEDGESDTTSETVTVRETTTVTAELELATGESAVDDTVLGVPAAGDAAGVATTNDEGMIDLTVPLPLEGETDDMTVGLSYYQGDITPILDGAHPDEVDFFQRDGSVDIFTLGEVDGEQPEHDLGSIELPEGHVVNTTVVDDGEPVEGAGLLYEHKRDDVAMSTFWESITNEDGQDLLSGEPGLELNGTVDLTVFDDDEPAVFRELEVTEEEAVVIDIAEQDEPSETILNGTLLDTNGESVTDGFIALYPADNPPVPYGIGNTGGLYDNAPVVIGLDEQGEFNETLPVDFEWAQVVFVQDDSDTADLDGLLPADGMPDVYNLGHLWLNQDTGLYEATLFDRDAENPIVDISPDHEGVLDVGEQTIPDGNDLEVTVVDPDGEPIEDALVRPWDSLTDLSSWYGLTNEDGEFVADRIPANLQSGEAYWQNQALDVYIPHDVDAELVRVTEDGETVIEDRPVSPVGIETGELETGTYYINSTDGPVAYDERGAPEFGASVENATWVVVESPIERTTPGIELGNHSWTIEASAPFSERFSWDHTVSEEIELTRDTEIELELDPVVDLEAEPTETPVGEEVEFNVTVDEEALGSNEAFDEIKLYFGDGENETLFDAETDEIPKDGIVATNHTYEWPDNATADVIITTVVDHEDDTHEQFYRDTVEITVENTPPVAVLDAPDTVSVSETFVLDASESEDAAGIELFEWEIIDEDGEVVRSMVTPGDEPIIETSIEESGEYNVTLTVVDFFGEEAETTVPITATGQANLAVEIDAADSQPLEENLTANVTVANIGQEAIENDDEFDVNLSVTGVPFDSEQAVTLGDRFSVSESLAGGESITEPIEFDLRDERIVGDVSLEAVADPQGEIEEATTETNIDVQPVEVTYANLETNVRAPSTAILGANVTLRSYVQNVGTGPSDDTQANVTVVDEGGDAVFEESVPLAELASDERERLSFVDSFDAPGTYDFVVEVEDELFPEGTVANDTFEIESYDLTVDEDATSVADQLRAESNATVVFGFETNTPEQANATLNLTGNEQLVFPDGGETETITVNPETDRTNIVAFEIRPTTESGENLELNFTVSDTIEGIDESDTLIETTNVTIPTERITNESALTIEEGEDETVALDVGAFGDSVTEEQNLRISLQAGTEGRTLEGLGYLVQYPYGCVEQTTSAFLGALNIDEYYDDRDEDVTPDQQDEINGSIERGIERLKPDGIRGQQDDGSWNQWGREGQAGQSYFTAYALLGVASVENNEKHSEMNRDQLDEIDYDDAVEWISDENWNAPDGYLDDEVASTGFTLVALDEVSETEELDAETEDTLVEIYADASLELLDQTEDVSDGTAWVDENPRSTALAVHGLQLALDADASEESADLDQTELEAAIDGGVSWLLANQNDDGSWDEHRQSPWFNDIGDQSETTSAALLALNETDQLDDGVNNESIVAGTDYLMDVYERDGSWGYPRATQAAINALNELTEEASERTVEITVSGAEGEEYVGEFTVDADDQRKLVSVSDEQLGEVLHEEGLDNLSIEIETTDGNGLTIVSGAITQQVEVTAIGGDE